MSCCLLSCSLEQSTSHNLNLSFQPVTSRNETSNWVSSLSSGGDFQVLTVSPPPALNGFSCLAVNVVGPGINTDRQARDLQGPIEDLLSGKTSCAYAGVTSAPIALSADAGISLQIPSGPSRLIQVVGVVDSAGVVCSSSAPVGQIDTPGGTVGFFEVGRQVVDLFSDTNVEIANAFDPASPRRVDCGSAQAKALAYAVPIAVYQNGVSITPNIPSITGLTGPYTFSVSPALPSGINLNVTSGALVGVPANTSVPTDYSVTATSGTGSVTGIVRISVVSALQFSPPTKTVPVNSMTFFEGTTGGGGGKTYSIVSGSSSLVLGTGSNSGVMISTTSIPGIAVIQVLDAYGQSAIFSLTVVAPKKVMLSHAGDSSCVQFTDGEVHCWGSNASGQWGQAGPSISNVPIFIPSMLGGTGIDIGISHSCGIFGGGVPYCWGVNGNGQLGDGTSNSSPAKVPVNTAESFVEVAVGANHSCGMTAAGAIRCWGFGANGRLGTGGGSDQAVPAAINAGGSTFIHVATGWDHSCALVTDGSVKCWGMNNVGQSGATGGSPVTVPATVPGVTGAVQIVGGSDFTCALLGTATVKCWGGNAQGQLGNGTGAVSVVPVTVGLTPNVSRISAGGNHACAVHLDGSLQCWGGNGSGQIGDGTLTNRLTPVQIFGPGFGILDVSLGAAHTCTVGSDAIVRCWGANSQGQLGDGTSADQRVPVSVPSFTAP